MKYVIIGGGPSGLCLLWILAKHNKNVVLIEKESQLGGSWNSTWDKNYWTENAPRVLFENGIHMDFLIDIGMKKQDFKVVYGDILSTYYLLTNFFTKQLEFNDYFQILKGYIYYKLNNDDHKTLCTWLNQSSMSKKGKDALRILCITVNDIPEKTNAKVFFNTLGLSGNFIQMSDSNKWHNLIENKLKNMKNVQIIKNTTIDSLQYENNNIVSALCINKEKSISYKIYGNKFVLCTQSNGIIPILEKSHRHIQNNWGDFHKLQKWNVLTHYNGFGFQLHFCEKINYPKDWCWSCKGDWTIIILPSSKWLTYKSKDVTIQTVWSCVVIDMDSKSKNIHKSLNDCDLDEALKECIFQIKKQYHQLPHPYYITSSESLQKVNNKWVSLNTGFTKNNQNYIHMKGNINNLFAIGCFNDIGYDHVASMKTAIESSCMYLQKYEPQIQDFHNKTKINYSYIFILFVLILCYYVYNANNKKIRR